MGRHADLEAHIGPATACIDAQGDTLLPGFVEAHIHLFSGAYGRKLL
ncbi:hypothetical protein ACN2XU_23940 [Primorskyibacter sp. 2E107]